VTASEAGARAGARAAVHVHHGAARCLLSLFDAAAEGLSSWADFDAEAERWGVDPRLSREDLAVVVEGSIRELPATEHRHLHQDSGDFARWGRRGGLKTLALYGSPYFALLACVGAASSSRRSSATGRPSGEGRHPNPGGTQGGSRPGAAVVSGRNPDGPARHGRARS
jgi:hypothetical protein